MEADGAVVGDKAEDVVPADEGHVKSAGGVLCSVDEGEV